MAIQKTITAVIKTRYDTAANFKTRNPILAAGEKATESDTHKTKTGDGKTVYNAVPYDKADTGLTFDTTPTAGSTNPVTSEGIKTALDGKLSLGRLEVKHFETNDNRAYPKLILLYDVTKWLNGIITMRGFVGTCCITRTGGLGTDMVANIYLTTKYFYRFIGDGSYKINTTNRNLLPCIVKEKTTGKYYLAIRFLLSSYEITFWGRFFGGEPLFKEILYHSPTDFPSEYEIWKETDLGGDTVCREAIYDDKGNIITSTYATKASIPTKTSQLTNDSGYITGSTGVTFEIVD